MIYEARLAEGAGLWSVDTTTGTSQLIVPDGGDPSTSADGKILVFAKAGREIWKANPDGTHAVRFDLASGGFPRVAPDGSRVFFIAATSGVQTSWLVDVAGGAPRQFVSLQASGFPVVSPDGSQVLVRSGVVDQPGTFSS